MANNITQQVHKSFKPNRSTFDISGNINLTTCAGMLLPLRVDDVLPNGHYEFNYNLFARTIALKVPTFARLRAYVDVFYVPYRLLGKDYQAIIVGDRRGMLSNYAGVGAPNDFSERGMALPRFNVTALFKTSTSGVTTTVFDGYKDAAGLSYNVTTPILLNALGYGVSSIPADNNASASAVQGTNLSKNEVGSRVTATQSQPVMRSFLYLQAYQKIYQDYFRNKLWEKEDLGAYYMTSNDDGNVTNPSHYYQLFEMRYRDYDKDRFLGIIPDETGVLSSGVSLYAADALRTGMDSDSVFGKDSTPKATHISPTSLNEPYHRVNSGYVVTGDNANNGIYIHNGGGSGFDLLAAGSGMTTSDSVIMTQYTALTLRRAEAMQKYAEICSLTKSDYKHQIKAHFGFTPQDLDSDYCTRIGGFSTNLNVSDIAGTSIDNLGELGARGTMSGGSPKISFTAPEHGCIMAVLSIVPQIDWTQDFPDRGTMRFDRYDFAIPEFDRLGFTPLRVVDLIGTTKKYKYNTDKLNLSSIIGYLPRYWSYKTRVDVNTTGFGSSYPALDFNSYIMRYDKTRILSALVDGNMFEAFKALPSDTDSMFSVNWTSVTTDPFVMQCYVSASASLPLSVDSLPY